MGRSSVSQRGFVSAVITLAFVAVVVGLAINFLLTRSDEQETLALRKSETDFAKMSDVSGAAGVAATLGVVASDVCAADISYDANNAASPYTVINCATSGSSFTCPCFTNPSDPFLDNLIPRNQSGSFRYLKVQNTSGELFSFEKVYPLQSSGQGAGPVEDTPEDETQACFSGDTLVLVGSKEGILKYQRIDSLKVGDYVLSVDQIGSEASMIGSMSIAESMKFAALKSIRNRLKPVRIAQVHKHTPPNEGAVKVSLNAGEIITTKSHPFMLYGKGWTSLGFFENRGAIVALDGSLNPVRQIENIEVPIDLYNISLQESFTYFVLPNGSTSPLWVHNATTGSKATGGTF